jgi:dihydrofolate reductase
MQKLVVSEFVSLDGVMEGPGLMDPFSLAGWTVPYVNEEFMAFKTEELMAAGALVLGRVTYDGFAAAWPTITDETGFANKMNSLPKYVVSGTLEPAEWNNSQIWQINSLVDNIKMLKESAEGDILVFGSSRLTAELSRLGLVDEYRLLTYPIILGKGKKLFVGDSEIKLHLVSEKAFQTGVVYSVYVPVSA